MRDISAKIDKLLTEAEDCELISRRATDAKKRELFKKLARDLRSTALDLELMIAARWPGLKDQEIPGLTSMRDGHLDLPPK